MNSNTPPAYTPKSTSSLKDTYLPSGQENTDLISQLLTQAANHDITASSFTDTHAHQFDDFQPDISEPMLSPTLTSYYGHELVAPAGVDILELKRRKKVRWVILTLVRVTEGKTLRVLAWQGDHDTFHLLNTLPGETELDEPDMLEIFGRRTQEQDRKDAERNLYLLDIAYGRTGILDSDITEINTDWSPAQIKAAELRAAQLRATKNIQDQHQHELRMAQHNRPFEY